MNLEPIRSAIARVTWPQVGLLAVVAITAIHAAQSLPEERWDALMGLAAGALASLGLAIGPSVMRGKDVQ
jgi:hypothetical protein